VHRSGSFGEFALSSEARLLPHLSGSRSSTAFILVEQPVSQLAESDDEVALHFIGFLLTAAFMQLGSNQGRRLAQAAGQGRYSPAISINTTIDTLPYIDDFLGEWLDQRVNIEFHVS
jgi:hypothetical protein